ncbi:MAG: outer membrane beta-barrel protein [Chromatiales bacterium]|nr:outer membrane beta-barrel protein [Chromatiales bacterium]
MNTGRSACRKGDRFIFPARQSLAGKINLSPFLKALLPVLILLPALSQAEVKYGVEITPFAGYRLGGQFESSEEGNTTGADIDIDDASSYGLIVNWPSVDNTEWEIYLGRQSTSLGTDGLFDPAVTPPAKLDITYLQAGGTYWFEGERAGPYIVATLGASRFEPDDSSFDAETFFAFGIGGGYKIAPTSRVGLRLEGRVFGSVVDSDEAVFCRAGGAASGCLIAVSGSVVWQWEVLAGLVFRL